MDERIDSLYVVLKVHENVYFIKRMAQWLSWLERRPVTAEVESSSLFWVVLWGLSSAGRASALQAEGHRFEPYRPHLKNYGWVPEWPKGADCKSVASCFGGSNPPPSIADLKSENADVAQFFKIDHVNRRQSS